MVTGTYSSPAEDEYFTVEEMHCCVSRFKEETDFQRRTFVEEFDDISLSDCSHFNYLECLREGSVLAVEIDESYHVCRVDYLEYIELSDEQKRFQTRDVVGTRAIAVLETLCPSMDPLLVDIFQKNDLRHGMSVRSIDLTVVNFDQQVDTVEDFDPDLLDKDSLKGTEINPQLLDSRLRVIEDNHIIEIFGLESDIISDKI